GLANSSLNLLTNGYVDLSARQQTLNNAVAWSYELLSPAEARLFRRISIFSGGATVDAVEAVCLEEADQNILKQLATLLDASLLQRAEDRHGEARFDMLATVRGYAADKLVSSGEWDGTGRRHALYYLGLANAWEKVLPSDRRHVWLDRMEMEHDNLRAALTWVLGGVHKNRSEATGAGDF